MDKVFYYNRKFPEFPIKEMALTDVLYIVGKKDKYIYSLVSKWNVDMDCEEDFDRPYHVYTPYEDEEILIYDNHLGNEIAISFNKKLIEDWHKQDCEILKHKLQSRLERL